MKTSELEYDLPFKRIAQTSVHPRDRSRLLVMGAGWAEHKKFFEIDKYLRAGDLLIFNNSKVFRARLRGEIGGGANGGKNVKLETRAEIFLLRPCAAGWECLGKPGKKLSVGARINFTKNIFGEVAERFANGIFVLKFFWARETKPAVLSVAAVIKFANAHGEIPVPPYIHAAPRKLTNYQTIYAKRVGSVAAPTAGFHFTKGMIKKLKARGVRTAEVTLHVGIGTFQPIKTETVEAHIMHAERAEVPARTAREIASAKKEGRRVIAVGTTSVRTIEAWARAGSGASVLGGVKPRVGVGAWSAEVNLFITPGFQFKVVDGLVTNFHLPKSTLLLLVAAFLEWRARANRQKIIGLAELKKIYAAAIKNNYRFFSFGDAMFLAPLRAEAGFWF